MKINFIGGNWKCNGSIKNILNLIKDFNNYKNEIKSEIVIAPTNIHINLVKNNLRKDFKLSVQNIWHSEGANTGEISADMVKDFEIDWTIIGHSERRHKISNEKNDLLFKKIESALNNNLNIIYCIGELLDERNNNKTLDICFYQLELLINNLKLNNWKNIVIAYEPVWAIGTGNTATPEEAEYVHSNIRNHLFENIGDEAYNVRIIYGGSVKPNNCKELIEKKNIDGFLVGGCSLKKDFLDIISIVDN